MKKKHSYWYEKDSINNISTLVLIPLQAVRLVSFAKMLYGGSIFSLFLHLRIQYCSPAVQFGPHSNAIWPLTGSCLVYCNGAVLRCYFCFGPRRVPTVAVVELHLSHLPPLHIRRVARTSLIRPLGQIANIQRPLATLVCAHGNVLNANEFLRWRLSLLSVGHRFQCFWPWFMWPDGCDCRRLLVTHDFSEFYALNPVPDRD